MTDNFNVSFEINKNDKAEVTINNYTKKDITVGINLGRRHIFTFLGLTPYEFVSQARHIKDFTKLVFDNKSIEKIIKETLRCNICLEIYHDPVNIKNCLHKFCKKCIEDYNRKVYFEI